MNMTIQEVANRLAVLQGVVDKAWPVKLAYAVSVNIDHLQRAADPAEKQRRQILERFARKDENGMPVIENNQYVIDDMDGFRKDIDQLMSEEADVDIRMVDAAVLDACDQERYDPVTPGTLLALKFMIKEE